MSTFGESPVRYTIDAGGVAVELESVAQSLHVKRCVAQAEVEAVGVEAEEEASEESPHGFAELQVAESGVVEVEASGSGGASQEEKEEVGVRVRVERSAE